jgi:hypothetical protein
MNHSKRMLLLRSLWIQPDTGAGLTIHRANSAQNWFKTLNDHVRPIMNCLRRTGDRAVKVAVLDTGIDSTHPRIQELLKWNCSSIKECKDWVASPDGIKDCVGHGTAVCDVLLQAAKVHLFVGKVSDSADFDGKTPARVAEVTLSSCLALFRRWN